jgi:hypothetical protein
MARTQLFLEWPDKTDPTVAQPPRTIQALRTTPIQPRQLAVRVVRAATERPAARAKLAAREAQYA